MILLINGETLGKERTKNTLPRVNLWISLLNREALRTEIKVNPLTSRVNFGLGTVRSERINRKRKYLLEFL